MAEEGGREKGLSAMVMASRSAACWASACEGSGVSVAGNNWLRYMERKPTLYRRS